jgi:hypothetical protein
VTCHVPHPPCIPAAGLPCKTSCQRQKHISAKAVDDQLIDDLVSRAQAEGLRLTGEGGLLQQLTKRLLQSALDGEITDHLGYDKHDPAGKDGGNSRNGKRSKTVLTDVGPVEIAVPRDRDGSFEPKIVKKRQKRLTGVDEMVISLAAKGLTTGEVRAHLAEVYGAEVSGRRSPPSPTKSLRAWPNGRTAPSTPLEFYRWLRTRLKETFGCRGMPLTSRRAQVPAWEARAAADHGRGREDRAASAAADPAGCCATHARSRC